MKKLDWRKKAKLEAEQLAVIEETKKKAEAAALLATQNADRKIELRKEIENSEAEKQKSRSLADEHSKKLKVKLELRAREQANTNRNKKKATKVSEMRSNDVPPTLPTSLGLTDTSVLNEHFIAPIQRMVPNATIQQPSVEPKVMQFLQNSKSIEQKGIHVQNQMPGAYQQTSKLGVPLQHGLSFNNLWSGNNPAPAAEMKSISPPSVSPWDTPIPAFGFQPLPPTQPERKGLYDDGDFVFNKIQEDIRRVETEAPKKFDERVAPNWPGSATARIARSVPPPGFMFPIPPKKDLWTDPNYFK